MAEIMQVQCFKCQTVYEVPPEMIGQVVECAICDSIFLVPALIANREEEVYATFPYVFPEQQAQPEQQQETAAPEPESQKEVAVSAPAQEKMTEPDPLATSNELNRTPAVTHTVKLSRSNIGMMPNIEDPFNVETVEVVPKFSFNEDDASKNSGDAADELGRQKFSDNKWWQFWKWFSRG